MFSVICIQETWLSEGADTSLIQLEGYKCIPQGKLCNSKGGLIIYLHENVIYKLKLELTKYITWDGQCIEVMRGKTLGKPLYIGNIYIDHQKKIWNFITSLLKNLPLFL